MMEKRQSLQQIFLGKLDICLLKAETRSIFVTLYKYQLKIVKDISIRLEKPEASAENREYTGNNRHRQGFPQ
jgi:hypothetical protein